MKVGKLFGRVKRILPISNKKFINRLRQEGANIGNNC